DLSPWWVYGTGLPVALGVAAFLGWVAAYPSLKKPPAEAEGPPAPAPMPRPAEVRYRRIGVAVELAPADEAVLAHAIALARAQAAPLVLMHVVEGPVAAFYGPETDDRESRQDRADMARLVAHLRDAGVEAEGTLGYGSPPGELMRLA